MFLNLQDKGLLLRIDTQALKVLDTWNVAPCGQPSAMDMDKKNERVFIGCRSGVFAAVDGNTGQGHHDAADRAWRRMRSSSMRRRD